MADGGGKRDASSLERVMLASERLRIYSLLAVFAAVGLVVILRLAIESAPAERWYSEAVPAVGILSLMSAYEIVALLFVRRGIERGIAPHPWLWPVNTVVECSFLTAFMVFATWNDFYEPYQALTSPVIVVYGILIILSTLRLSPGLCVIAGLACGLGHAGVLTLTLVRAGPPEAEGLLRLPIYWTFPVILLFSGIVAAFVAARVRKHAAAEISEGEAREKMSRDLQLARSIQQGLLPITAPSPPGFDIAGFNEPADETGGDYYDWRELADGQIAITIADVTGHGVGPALVAAVSRAYVRTSLRGSTDLQSVLSGVNDLLGEDLRGERFVTCAVGVLNPADAEVEILSAGHGPLVHFQAARGTVHTFNAHGIPLGIMPGAAEYDTPERFKLEPGDALVFVTDGFFEWARADGTQFGTERLGACIAQNAGTAEGLIRAMRRAVTEFAGGTAQDDDLTAVVVVRTPSG
ncbi:MAG: PP2C family protein-serine/threonine phosphatase [Planctomycetota bacterium]